MIKSFVENFVKIHQSVWATELPHTDTHTHTHTHTYTLGSIATYSVNMTEYKNTHKVDANYFQYFKTFNTFG